MGGVLAGLVLGDAEAERRKVDAGEHMPKANVIFVYDAGHSITEDRPESAAAIIRDFLGEARGFW